jgi:hypothetical protein
LTAGCSGGCLTIIGEFIIGVVVNSMWLFFYGTGKKTHCLDSSHNFFFSSYRNFFLGSLLRSSSSSENSSGDWSCATLFFEIDDAQYIMADRSLDRQCKPLEV